jgi:sugar phosphate isomerase/epimerase
MKIGVCIGGENNPLRYREAGFEFVEEQLCSLAACSEEEFAQKKALYEQGELEVLATNLFFPSGISLFRDDIFDYLDEFLPKAAQRAKSLGVGVCVLGSAGQRTPPAGYDFAKANEHIVKVIRYCCDALALYGLKLAIEPLKRGETNVINTVQEGIDAAKSVARENCGFVLDFFHAYMNGEDLSTLAVEDVKKYLFHVHIARPNADRGVPREEDLPVLRKWKKQLDAFGYDKTLSLESGASVEEVLAARRILGLFE